MQDVLADGLSERSLVARSLLEREQVLERLAGHLDQARAGRGRLVLVHGEAGVGKTAVVRRFAETVGSTVRVLVGACDALTTPRPMGPLLDVATELGPRLAEALEQAGSGTSSVSAVFQRLLTQLRGEPVVVVFEDVHWADEATLDLMRYLARRIDQTPALMVTTYRDDQLGPTHPLAVALGDLATSPAVHRCPVEPLSREAVARLAAGHGVAADELHRVTGGNPFFVTEVLATEGQRIPATVREVVTGRLARLTPASRALADALAVIGVPSPPELVTAVVPDAEAALEEALTSGVLHVDGLLVGFRHELARRAVYDAVPVHRRVRWHARVLNALRSSREDPDGLARLAYHAEEARDIDAVLGYAPAAAMRAMALRAHREAAAQCDRALRHAAALPPERRLPLLVGRSFACYCTGPMSEAISSRQAALELRRALGDRLGEGEDLFWLSHMLRVAGRLDQAAQIGQEAVRVLGESGPSPQLAGAHLNLAELAVVRHDFTAIERHVGEAMRLGEELRSAAICLQARFHAATGRLIRTGEGWDELDAVRRDALRCSPEEHVGQIAAIMAYVATVRRDFARALPATDWAVDYCIDHDLTLLMHAVRSFAAYGLLHRGLWTQATELAGTVLGHPGLPDGLQVLPMVVLGLVRARRGDPQVWAALDAALDLVEPTHLLLNHVWQARAEAAWLAGDDTRAEAEARRGLRPVTALSHPDPWMAGGLARWILLASDRHPEMPAAEPLALELGRDWRAAAAAWDCLGCPYDAAIARLGGDAGALRQALDTFEALGAEPAAVRTRERMRALGLTRHTRGPHPGTRAHPYRLTKREVEVAGLLREGLSDAEIAERLVITTKTASSHVSAILAKLDVRTRHQAARKLD